MTKQEKQERLRQDEINASKKTKTIEECREIVFNYAVWLEGNRDCLLYSKRELVYSMHKLVDATKPKDIKN